MRVLVYPEGSDRLDVCDIFVGTLGYETRSTNAFKKLDVGRERIAAAFSPSNDYAYQENKYFLEESLFEIFDYESGSFKNALKSRIEIVSLQSSSIVSLVVDITSMSRPMIADTVATIADMSWRQDIKVIFCYSPAIFHEPGDIEASIAVSEPVIPRFSGWAENPAQAISTVIGLGFEAEQALGVNEFLEPSDTWLFIPSGFDDRFAAIVEERNADLIDEVSEARAFSYKLKDPLECYRILEGLVYGLSTDTRPILIPLGPKLFALLCILVAINYSDKVTVWRVSGQKVTQAADRLPNGELVTFSAIFTDKQESDLPSCGS